MASVNGLFFSAHQHAECAICHRPTVRLSVTRLDQPKTVRIIKLSPYGSPIPLVFEGYDSSRNSNEMPHSGYIKQGWDGDNKIIF